MHHNQNHFHIIYYHYDYVLNFFITILVRMFPPSGDAKKRQNVCCAYVSSGASFRVICDRRLKKGIFEATFKDDISAIVQLWVVNSVQCRKAA